MLTKRRKKSYAVAPPPNGSVPATWQSAIARIRRAAVRRAAVAKQSEMIKCVRVGVREQDGTVLVCAAFNSRGTGRVVKKGSRGEHEVAP